VTRAEAELVGEPCDGKVMCLPSQPPGWLRVPVAVPNAAFEPVDPTTPMYRSFEELTYHRCVISDATHRWRYVLGAHDACRTWPVQL
jgi:hypothetical protein